jgi:PKHD-type hydroxylase
MVVQIPGLLDRATLAQVHQLLREADWADGRITAGHQSARVKHNRQLPEGHPSAQAAGELVLRALEQCPLFFSAVLPQRVFPPLFNRYDQGMSFGPHVDNAIRALPGGADRLRTDVSATLFLSDPASYDGGELVVEDTHGSHPVKLGAGDLVVYPASSLHQVTPITRGVRLASFFWVQSMVRDVGQRSLLFDLDMAIVELSRQLENNPARVVLTGVYHNLLRRWAEP